jgi:hypothetical protein
MANAYKILGQAVPATSSDIITVGAGKSQVVSTLVVANTTSSAATVRVYARIAGAAAATSNAIIYDVTVLGNTTQTYTMGITLAATDVLTVVSGTSGALTVTAFGSEIS